MIMRQKLAITETLYGLFYMEHLHLFVLLPVLPLVDESLWDPPEITSIHVLVWNRTALALPSGQQRSAV